MVTVSRLQRVQASPHLIVISHDGVAVERVEGVNTNVLGAGLDGIAPLSLNFGC